MMVRGAAIIILGVACVWAGRGTQEGKTIKVFYLPFGTETYVPVTRQSIANDAACTFEVESRSAEAAGLKSLLTSGTASSFDDRVVRLKVVGLLPDIVFVNQEGESIRELGRAYRLSDSIFAELRTLMQDLSRAHGCLVSSATSRWDAYLQHPSAETYRPLAEALRSCHDAECARRLYPSPSEVDRLISIVGGSWRSLGDRSGLPQP